MGLWGAIKGWWRGTVREATAEEIYGRPVDFWDLYTFRGMPLVPLAWGPETRPERAATLRALADHTRARNECRQLAESNPNAAGLIERVQDYVVGRGSTTEVHGVEGEDTVKRLVKQVTATLDAFKRANAWEELELEIVERLITDGEFFLRFYPDEDNVTKVRFIEPAQVQPPSGESQDGPWSYGVHTPDGDVTRPYAYNVHDFQTGEDEEVEAQFILHGKLAKRNQKRGVPMLWACTDDLEGSARLRHATREGEKVRAGIAYFRQHAQASEEAVRALQDASYTDEYVRTTLAGNRTVRVQKVDVGDVVDIPKGLEVQPPPSSPNSASAGASVTESLEAVAARFGLAAWCVTGASDATSFASSLTAESPMVKSIERNQGRLGRWVDEAQTKAIEIAVEQEELPEDTLERVDLLVSFPSPATRNKAEETGRRKELSEAGIISKAKWRAEEGYEETEVEQIAKESAEAQAVAPPAPGANGAAPSGTPAARYAQLARVGEGNFFQDCPRDELGHCSSGGGGGGGGGGGKKPLKLSMDREMVASYAADIPAGASVEDIAAHLQGERDRGEAEYLDLLPEGARAAVRREADRIADADDKIDGTHWEDWATEELARRFPVEAVALALKARLDAYHAARGPKGPGAQRRSREQKGGGPGATRGRPFFGDRN